MHGAASLKKKTEFPTDMHEQCKLSTLYGPEHPGGCGSLFLAIMLLTLNQIEKIGSETT